MVRLSLRFQAVDKRQQLAHILDVLDFVNGKNDTVIG
jgi:hypothetical protein